MFPDQQSRRRAHRVQIQWRVVPTDLPLQYRRTHRTIQQQVSIATPRRGKSGVKIIRYLASPANGNRRWQIGIRASDPRRIRAHDLNVEMNYLIQSMHPGIGAAGADGSDRNGCNRGQGALEHILHGVPMRL